MSASASNDPRSRRSIVVLNSNDDLLVRLAEIVENAGFDVVTLNATEIDREPEAIQDFLRRHNPKAVVYDVGPPYPENWTLYRKVYEAELRSGSRRQFVVTTPNNEALKQHVDAAGAIELAPDRIDREAIERAIRQAMID